jgi:hypothetical protein
MYACLYSAEVCHNESHAAAASLPVTVAAETRPRAGCPVPVGDARVSSRRGRPLALPVGMSS